MDNPKRIAIIAMTMIISIKVKPDFVWNKIFFKLLDVIIKKLTQSSKRKAQSAKPQRKTKNY